MKHVGGLTRVIHFVSRKLLSRGGQLRQRGYYRLYVAFAVPGPTVILVSPSID